MNELLQNTLTQNSTVDVRAFLPELVLCLAIVSFLLIRLVPRYNRWHMGWIALIWTAMATVFSFMLWYRFEQLDPRADSMIQPNSFDLFGGMLIYDNFGIFLKMFLMVFTTLTIILTLMTRIPDREDSADFYCLLLGSVIGMSMMASSNHLLMVFLSIEMASLPSYAMAGFLKGRRQSSEAALKYVVYGGGASGVMLYGISLVAGHPSISSGFLPTVVQRIGEGGLIGDPVILMGVIFILVGIGFKLAAFPFHFWCPDVFEGAAAEVAAFLSVSSKGAALALLARIVMGLAGLTGREEHYAAWTQAVDYLVPILAVFAVVTMTFGNLAAYGQTNLKRLLAYSTIAHAGFMMMGLATLTKTGVGAVLFYLVTYLFMNLGAFGVVAMMRNITGQEDLAYYRGFVYRAPVLVIMLGVFLLSLIGLPPLAGFAAKFQIFAALFDAAGLYNSSQVAKPHLGWIMYGMVLAGGINTVISLFYYIKVLKVMALEKTLEEVEDRPIVSRPVPIAHALYASFLALVVLVLGIVWNPIAEASLGDGVQNFRSEPSPEVKAPVGPKKGPDPGPAPIPEGGKKK
jgi:NADH-quinone oxidoreductase subunit N